MSDHLSRAMLRFNPFEPVASGAPVGVSLWLPDRWQSALTRSLDAQLQAPGVTTLVVTGAYGSGKTHTLAWLREVALPARRILPFYFDNPGVQFYYIANELLDQIGRKELAKRLWELASSYVRIDQRSLYPEWGFEEYLRGRITRKGWDATRDIQEALLRAGITEKEQIAYQFARIVTEFPNKPYFDYQDFVPGKSTAEGTEDRRRRREHRVPHRRVRRGILAEEAHEEGCPWLPRDPQAPHQLDGDKGSGLDNGNDRGWC